MCKRRECICVSVCVSAMGQTSSHSSDAVVFCVIYSLSEAVASKRHNYRTFCRGFLHMEIQRVTSADENRSFT